MKEFFAIFVGIRKLIITIMFLGIILWLRISDLINGAEFIDGAKAVLTAYMGTNVGEWFVKGLSGALGEKIKKGKDNETE
jgi:hypothetical protein